ncbi:hypothetical protein WEB32_14155 [Streptomyces netropsis]|uniref:C2H2-type domain-containing protein n=1 Tax=Streptomyces netropsis TaxID=55404 RepID=A0A7W7LC98_STRNE|nr:hypothetical protein [Streptomyces netropsis]MBB4887021.1 hypothetical protein [Streptomyces netropsis]GGR24947.1 hypothetical protein GCM10010219_32200 [Streptomyces netropsis]
MSETAGTSSGVQPIAQPRTLTEPRTPRPGPAGDVGHESYAFACMRCAYGWEQSYEIEHHTDAEGRAFVTYYADGERVPSPLTRPTCVNCGGHVVRIMRSGQVTQVADALHMPTGSVVATTGPLPTRDTRDTGAEPRHDDADRSRGHWHLSDLLKPFHRK